MTVGATRSYRCCYLHVRRGDAEYDDRSHQTAGVVAFLVFAAGTAAQLSASKLNSRTGSLTGLAVLPIGLAVVTLALPVIGAGILITSTTLLTATVTLAVFVAVLAAVAAVILVRLPAAER